jgi:hypothetical protein
MVLYRSKGGQHSVLKLLGASKGSKVNADRLEEAQPLSES